MKSKLSKSIKIVLVLLAGVVLTALFFYMIDDMSKGFLGAWFERTYMSYQGYSYGENGYYAEQTLNWGKLKGHILLALILITVFWLIVVLVVSSFKERRAKKQVVDVISEKIHFYINQDIDSSAVFPDEYAKISAEMAEIKFDITRKEQILKEEATRKNDLITYLAHDLKTPLTSVIGYLSLLEEAPEMPSEQRAKYVHISLDKALRLEKLINEFFEITRYNLQQIDLEKEIIDLSYMLVQMTDEFYPILKEHGNTIEIEADEELTVCADSIKLARVFNNILKNAVAYSYPDSTITVRAFSENECIYISFQNRGQTIPKQKLESLFEKFFRLDAARNTNTGGAGLGLAIAREIVTLHGGTITANSENECTTFVVCLPCQD